MNTAPAAPCEEPTDWRKWTPADWQRLEELRAGFLQGKSQDYWRNERDLQLYEAVFGQRIAWKWRAVLSAWPTRDGPSPQSVIWDWGCGSGIASHLVATFFDCRQIILTDQSPLAVRHAATRHRQAGRAILSHEQAKNVILAVSHVLGELSPEGVRQLLADTERARLLLWVEPGDRRHAQLLAGLRDLLLAQGWRALLPCPHQLPCPAGPNGGADWCHFFARPPAEAFQSAFWRTVSLRLGLDLRSLPVSFLILQRGTAVNPSADCRILGRPRRHKAYTTALLCRTDGQLHQTTIPRRTQPKLYRALDKWLEFPGVWPETPSNPHQTPDSSPAPQPKE